MPSEPLTLGFDTSGPHVATALLRGSNVLASLAEPMQRGQAERLFPLLEELLASQDLSLQDLNKLGVGVGPGNFTGIRIAVSAARGLSLSLGIPAVGVDGFEVARFGADPTAPAILPAPREQVYLSAPPTAPSLVLADDAPREAFTLPPAQEAAVRIARIARQSQSTAAPSPLYLKPADAAPSSDPPPRILDAPAA